MKLYDPGTLKDFLGRHGVKADKGLGQHFLCSRSVVEAVVESLAGFNGMLEIGPGPGVLTSPLSEAVENLVALELDSRMLAMLAESSPKADARKADALKADLREILVSLPEPRGVVSNLPYYITGPLLQRIAECRDTFSKAVLMMQKEVAERVIAKAGSPARGSLSAYLQAQFTITVLVQAPAGCFLPPPKVDSTVLEFVPRALSVPVGQEETFFRLIRQGFSQPRKTLVNNLVSAFGMERVAATDLVEGIDLAPNIRPQQLTNEQWVALAASYSRQCAR